MSIQDPREVLKKIPQGAFEIDILSHISTPDPTYPLKKFLNYLTFNSPHKELDMSEHRKTKNHRKEQGFTRQKTQGQEGKRQKTAGQTERGTGRGVKEKLKGNNF